MKGGAALETQVEKHTGALWRHRWAIEAILMHGRGAGEPCVMGLSFLSPVPLWLEAVEVEMSCRARAGYWTIFPRFSASYRMTGSGVRKQGLTS